MGSIITSQPFYRRTLYNNETLVASGVDVATFALLNASSEAQGDVLADYAFWKDRGCVAGTQRTTPLYGLNPQEWGGAVWMSLAGPYTYDAESVYLISQFIDGIGDYVTMQHLFESPSPAGLTQPTHNSSRSGIAEYDKSRHQY